MKTVKKMWGGAGVSPLLIVLAAAGVCFISFMFLGRPQISAAGKDLIIPKSQVSQIARFYPYKAGSTYMEIIAVKAGDGSIRTAFNTCQVCFDSGRGYYTQVGDVLVCNNCGNRFRIDQVERIKGGCNPVPILKENKKDDGKNIIISGTFLAKNAFFFARWKRG